MDLMSHGSSQNVLHGNPAPAQNASGRCGDGHARGAFNRKAWSKGHRAEMERDV